MKILGILQSPPIQIIITFFISVLAIFLLLATQLGISIALLIYSIASYTRLIDCIISLVLKIVRAIFPQQYNTIDENTKKSFIFINQGNNPLQSGLYLWHPHGLFATAPYIHCIMGKGEGSERMSLATLSLWFRIPFLRNILYVFGFIDSNYKSIKASLEEDKPTSLVVGGVEEMFYVEPKKMNLILKKRQGYLKLALETKKPLIPILTYGENELYECIPELTNTWWNRLIKEYTGFMIPFISWKSITQWKELSEKSFDEPIKTYVGDAVYIQQGDTIESLRERYIGAVKKLFEATKPDGYELNIL